MILATFNIAPETDADDGLAATITVTQEAANLFAVTIVTLDDNAPAAEQIESTRKFVNLPLAMAHAMRHLRVAVDDLVEGLAP